MKAKQLNVFDFSDYRKYLKSWIQEARREKRSNLSRLAAQAKVHPTFFSQMLAGTKQLSLEQAAELSLVFAHTELERDYFFLLVQEDRAGNPALRGYWREKKAALLEEKNKLSRRFEPHHTLTDSQRALFYSSWIYLAAWVSTDIDGGQTLEQVAERFGLSRKKAQGILSFLLEIGACGEKGGRYSLQMSHIHVGNESPFVTKHHSNWRVKALERMDFRQPEELFFTAPLSLSRKDFLQIREKLNVLAAEVVALAKESRAEDVFCLNVDFFRTKGA